MILEQFVTKYNGKMVDFDGKWPGQCVDLYRFYLRDVWNVPQTPPVNGAADIYDSLPSSFIKVPNTITAIPESGDVIIWNRKYGEYGHVGIVTEAGMFSFKAFEQNDPPGSVCRIKSYGYKNIIGWFRPKGADSMVLVRDGGTFYVEGDQGYYGINGVEYLRMVQKMTNKVELRKPNGKKLGVIETTSNIFQIKDQ